MDAEREIEVPLRPDGTQRAFWYDRPGNHILHHLPDGTLVAIGFHCRHNVQVNSD